MRQTLNLEISFRSTHPDARLIRSKEMANFGEGGGNAFVNDGSFMEMFKRLQEQQKDKIKEPTSTKDKEECSEGAGGGASEVALETQQETSEKNMGSSITDTGVTEKATASIDPPLVKASQVAEYIACLYNIFSYSYPLTGQCNKI